MESLSRKNDNLTFSQVNITNLVDVALTLVVILLIIAPFIEQGIEVNLPVSAPAQISVEDSIIITAAPGDIYYIGDARVSLREMYNILREKRRETADVSIIVKGDETVPYSNIIKVLDIAKRCDIERVGLATQTE